MACPEIKKIVEENNETFAGKLHDLNKDLILTLFCIFEWQKGKESFWFPYFDHMPEHQCFYEWPASS